MRVIETSRAVAAQTMSTKGRLFGSALLTLLTLSACVTDQIPARSTAVPTDSKSSGALVFPIPTESDKTIEPNFSPVPTAPMDPKDFALDLMSLVGASPNKCGAAAANSPQVNWICAEYTLGLENFMITWDWFASSPEVAKKHAVSSESNWMYFEEDDEIDFFWKAYNLESTQALVAYDPSEKGNELIIGLNPIIGDQFEVAHGSYIFTTESILLPIQN